MHSKSTSDEEKSLEEGVTDAGGGVASDRMESRDPKSNWGTTPPSYLKPCSTF